MKGRAISGGKERSCNGKRGNRSREGDNGYLQPYNEAKKRAYG